MPFQFNTLYLFTIVKKLAQQYNSARSDQQKSMRCLWHMPLMFGALFLCDTKRGVAKFERFQPLPRITVLSVVTVLEWSCVVRKKCHEYLMRHRNPSKAKHFQYLATATPTLNVCYFTRVFSDYIATCAFCFC